MSILRQLSLSDTIYRPLKQLEVFRSFVKKKKKKKEKGLIT